LAPNVVLCIVDSLHADHVNRSGYPDPLTPNLDAIAAAGASFENAIATASWTVPSVFSIFTGAFPHKHGYYDPYYRLNRPSVTLARRLRQNGYTTVAFSANNLVCPSLGFGEGFEDFYEFEFAKLGSSLQSKIGRRVALFSRSGDAGGMELVRRFQAWVTRTRAANSQRPFFAYLHFMEVHERSSPLACGSRGKPFYRAFLEIPRRFQYARIRGWSDLIRKGNVSPAVASLIRERYVSSVKYVDSLLGLLSSTLRAHGLWGNTLFIITSDHGEMLGEQGNIGHGRFLTDGLVRVPLIISYPGRIHGPIFRAAQVQTVDIFPTILEFSTHTAEGHGDAGNGVGLCRLIEGEDQDVHPLALIEHRQAAGLDQARSNSRRESEPTQTAPAGDSVRALRSRAIKFLSYSNGSYALYDLVADPQEQTDIAASHPSEIAFYAQLIEELFGDSQESTQIMKTEEMIVETRLRSLGYVD